MKITPHFDIPPKKAKVVVGGDGASKEPWELHIRFTETGRRFIMDIEECPITTPILNDALGPACKGVQESIDLYKKGATLLLRDSLVISTMGSSPEDSIKAVSETTGSDAIVDALSNSLECHFPTGSFFQKNNSILEPLTSYVHSTVLGMPGSVPMHQEK
ncbi:hypothetical protein JB92DRAFT_3107502 [Gautieria morchelliformis]|nr:hypothetical protein JB92DRAFT_3107502 [Gautieria morchelliformis]